MGFFGDFFEDTWDFVTEDVIDDPISNVVLPAAGAAAVIATGGGAGFPLAAYLIAGGLGAGAGIAAGQIISGQGVLGDLLSGSKEKIKAEELINQGIAEGTAVQQAALERSLELTQPFRAAGTEAIGPLREIALTPPGQFTAGERFQQREAEKAGLRGLSATGKVRSGVTPQLFANIAGNIASGSEARRIGALGTLFAGGQQQSGLAAQGALATGAGRAETLTGGLGNLANIQFGQQGLQNQRLGIGVQGLGTLAQIGSLFA